jgi:hypothetical protein
MNPNSSETGPQFELPKTPEGLEKQRERAMEEQVAEESKQTKKLPKTPQDAQVAPVQATPPVVIPVKDVKTDRKGTSTLGSDLPADDADLIEKQWVHRAKAIVAQTQDDPYKQKKEMGKVKAEYIKKRFNKTIPSDDAVSA